MALYDISNMVTEGYKTDSGMVLFIEPDLNRVEALVKGFLVLRLQFDKDNKSWEEADFSDPDHLFTSEGQQLKREIIRCYEHVMGQRNIHYQKNFDPRRKIC